MLADVLSNFRILSNTTLARLLAPLFAYFVIQSLDTIYEYGTSLLKSCGGFIKWSCIKCTSFVINWYRHIFRVLLWSFAAGVGYHVILYGLDNNDWIGEGLNNFILGHFADMTKQYIRGKLETMTNTMDSSFNWTKSWFVSPFNNRT
jgi:hypothetical protein